MSKSISKVSRVDIVTIFARWNRPQTPWLENSFRLWDYKIRKIRHGRNGMSRKTRFFFLNMSSPPSPSDIKCEFENICVAIAADYVYVLRTRISFGGRGGFFFFIRFNVKSNKKKNIHDLSRVANKNDA